MGIMLAIVFDWWVSLYIVDNHYAINLKIAVLWFLNDFCFLLLLSTLSA